MAWEFAEPPAKRGIALLALGLGVLLSGCMQQTIEPASDANLTPRDRKLLANPPYAQGDDPRAVSAPHRRLSPQGSAGHDRGRSGCALSLLRAREGQGDPLRRDRRRRGAGVLRRRQGRPQGRVAVVDADRRHQEAARPAFRISSAPARTIRSARAASICSPATGTRCTASTAPTSRNTSARRSPRAASA